MLKEVVSLAIILGFVLNIFYVDHPNTQSYTTAFVISLVAISPFLLAWKWWTTARNRRISQREEECGSLMLGSVTVSEVLGGDGGAGPSADIEKGDVTVVSSREET
jgi:hypothetical protein